MYKVLGDMKMSKENPFLKDIISNLLRAWEDAGKQNDPQLFLSGFCAVCMCVCVSMLL